MRYPVSFAQRRIWFLEQLAPGKPTFHMAYATWLRGPLDPERLQRAFDTVVARHAALRTSIVAVDGTPEQVVLPDARIVLRRADPPPIADEDERAKRAMEMGRAEACEPFDLTRGPLARALLIHVGHDRWLLMLTVHHIISDGMSMVVLWQELSLCYRAELAGEPSALERLPIQYGDFAVWQHDRIRGEELDRQLGFWRERMRGAPDLLALPTVKPRPSMLTFRGAVRSVMLDAAVTARLGDLASRHNATMFMALLAGVKVVLSRYAHQSDIVIATAVAARTHRELDPMFGLFTNTLALRTSLAGDPTFVEVLGRVRDTTADALAHEELPFEKLVEALQPERSLAYAPLCQVQFGFRGPGEPMLDLPGITVSTRAITTGTAKMDVTFFADVLDSGQTELTVEYSVDLFDEAWADRFLDSYVTVMTSVVETPTARVADVPLLAPEQWRALREDRNRPSRPPNDMTFDDVLDRLRASTSMVDDEDGRRPMAEVCAWAARLARALAERGVGPETPVGLYLDRGAGLLAGMLGIWWAGGAYVPLDPGFPPARLAAMARDAGLRVVVTSVARRADCESVIADAVTVCVDDSATTVDPTSASVPAPASAPGSALAYTIFTSGSTGVPKGVSVTRRALSNLLGSFAATFELRASDRFVAVTTLSFDIAVLELLLAPMCGADLVIAGAAQAREPDALRALIEGAAATAMQATPQTWRLLAAAGGVPGRLRLRLCGGEALPRDLADELTAPQATLWNLYGPTETTVWSAAGVVAGGEAPVGIGPPIDNTRVYLLDARQMPVPPGVIGEVYLAGRGLARGYHGRPRLTAAQFTPDPWSEEPGARMYRTGDLGSWCDGGGLRLIGRTDHQVKVRGFRIECGEIEAALRAQPEVRQAAVIPVTRGGEPCLVAYVVLRRARGTGEPEAERCERLRSHLSATLPDYMLPALVTALPALPLTANGKVDRAALPAPAWDGARGATPRVAPRDDVEETLTGIWAELIGSDTPVSVHDNLFEIGGHSLTATRLVSRVSDMYGVDLAVHQVFATPTIAELAALVSADPGFVRAAPSHPSIDLDALSDEDLDGLLRAALAQRSRRQAGADDTAIADR